MKKILVVLALVVLCSLSMPAAPYVVFKVKGNITRIAEGENVSLKPREEIGLKTVLDIPEGAQVTILDKETKRIFRSLKSGKMSVRSILKEARAHADAIVKNAGGIVMRSLEDGTAGGAQRPQGSIVRGDGDKALSLEKLVANAILTEAYSPECPVSFRRSYNADSTYVYEIISERPEALYVNIADVSSSPAILLFDVRYSQGEPFVTVGKGSTLIDAYEFYGEDAHRYVLVASNYPFDVQSVQSLLKGKVEGDNNVAVPDGIQLWLSSGK